MSDPPPLRLALPPDLMFEGSTVPPPPPALHPSPSGVPDDDTSHGPRPDHDGQRPLGDITTTLRNPELFGIELDGPIRIGATPDHTRRPAGEAADPTLRDDPAPDDDPGPDDDPDGGSSTGRRIRPYTITGGRTAVGGPEIPLEAQILTSNHQPIDPSRYRWETARLVQMLEAPMALIEVAARLRVPVGVARVLVSDLVAEGVLIVHLPPPSSSFTSLLEQVLDGVRKL